MDTAAIIQQLKEFSELHTLGVLTDEEFADAKAALIAQMKPVNPPTSNNGSGPQTQLALTV